MTEEKTGTESSILFSEEAEADVKKPWEDDALGREKFSKHLTDLVNSVGNVPFCVAVDGGWGSGKTFFLQRWRAEFAKKDKAVSEQGNVIYFNAWEDDFHVDPLTAIIGQLREEIKDPVLKKICISCMKFCNSISRKMALGLLGKKLGNINVTKKDWQTGVDGTVEEYLKTRKNITALQSRLKKLAKAVRDKTKLPLVVIVDELDRCRPTFAIELLERVKHVVGVPGVVFVFGVNLKELGKSIKSVYGDIDSADYLRRFFHPPFLTLPQADASKYCRHLINKHEIIEKIRESPVHKETLEESGWDSATIAMPSMAGYMELSLRQTEQAVSMLLFILNSKEIADKRGVYEFEGYLVILILLRIKDRDLYEKFFDEKYKVQEAIYTTMGAMLDFLPWEKVRDREFSEVKNCIVMIVLAFYSFYTEQERHIILGELRRAYNEVGTMETLSERYDYVPSKIIEIQDHNVQGYVVERLLRRMAHLVKNHHISYSSRKEIARLLEWGDYWRE